MLSFFPQLLFLAPAGTMLLRVAAALCFLYMAWDFFKRAHEIDGTEVMLIGHMRSWMVQLSAVFTALIGILLLVGAWTQIAAMFGALVSFKHLFWFNRYQAILPLAKGTYILLLCICLALIVTGAGAFSVSLLGTTMRTSFDLPL